MSRGGAGVDLYWLPLGAGGHFARLNGRLYEAVVARLERRHGSDLYHLGAPNQSPPGEFVIEASVADPFAEQR